VGWRRQHPSPRGAVILGSEAGDLALRPRPARAGCARGGRGCSVAHPRDPGRRRRRPVRRSEPGGALPHRPCAR
jgi:hypothetical protein